jgi:MFS family permease
MIVQFKSSALRQTRWYEYLVRFVLGGAMTVVAGLIAARFGPIIGGLFLAFPAIFPASATLIEKHVREGKEKAGLPGARRGKEAAALNAAGAVLGSFGLAAFGLVIWLMIVQSPAWALVLAAAAWLAVAVLGWQVRRWLQGVERGMGDQLLPLPRTERTVHLCVDMQRIFSAEGPSPTP